MCIEHFFKTGLNITAPDILNKLLDVSWIELLPRGQKIVSAGEKQLTMSFLLDGIVRGYLVDENGQEITDGFICRRGEAVVGDLNFWRPAAINLDAVTDCRLLFVPMSTVLQIFDHPQIMRVHNQQLLYALDRNWQFKILLCQSSAMQRYLWFRDHFPDLERSVSSKHLASYLSMTPVTLSRLRRRLKEGPREDEPNSLDLADNN